MNNDIFPKDVREAADKIESEWITPSEFEKGLTLQLIKPLEAVKASNPKYGAKDDDYLVKNNVLGVGEQFRYTFKTKNGNERHIDSKSPPLFIAFKQCEDLGVGDWVLISRTGETTETRYTVEKVEDGTVEEVSQDKVEYPEEELDPKSIPF